MLWGTVAQTIKALAILYDQRLGTHRSITEFMRRLSIDKKDMELFSLYESTEKFHVNFYDEILDHDEIFHHIEILKEFLKRMDKLIEERIREIKNNNS